VVLNGDNAEVRPNSSRVRLDHERDRATCVRDPLWARHPGDRFFHFVDRVWPDANVLTLCAGSWPGCDTVEIDDDPPVELRCGCCVVRHLAEQGVPT
jgi:hypothetical protein